MSAHGNPLGADLPPELAYTPTPPVTCSRYGYTAPDGVEYEIALFHRGAATAGWGVQAAAFDEAEDEDEDEDADGGYGRLEREHAASLHTDPYAGTPWLEAVKLVMRERRHGRGWRGYGYATLLHRDRLPAAGWPAAVRRWAAGPRVLGPGRAADPCAELGAFARAHLVGEDEDADAPAAAASRAPGRRRGQFRDGAAAAAIDGARLVPALLPGGRGRHHHPLRPLVVIERFLVYPGAWRRGLGRAAFDALAETLFLRLGRPWVFVARPSYQRAETEAYLAEMTAAAVPLGDLRRGTVAFWAALGFRQFRNTPYVYNLGRPVFESGIPPAGDGDDGPEAPSAGSSEARDTPPPSSDDELVVWFP